MAFFDIEMQFNAAPAKAIIQQVTKGRSLAEVPLPAALASKILNKTGQVGQRLGGDMLRLHAFAIEEAKAKLQSVLDNGKAAEIFGRMVAAQDGPNDFIENYDNYLPTAAVRKPVFVEQSGFVSAMDTRDLGLAVVSMGGGRRQASDIIDYSVGITDIARLGDKVDATHPLAVIHAKDEHSWQEAAKAVKAAITLGDKAPEATPTVYRRISQ